MVVMEMMGGLGNQMFQYAFYLNMIERGKKVLIDTSLFDDTGFNYALSCFPKVYCDFYTGESVFGKGIQKKMKREILRRSGRLFEEDQKRGEWDPRMLNIDDCFAYGYYQNEKYFINHADKVRQSFEFFPVENVLNEYIDLLEQHNTVSIHIRKGDYVTLSDIYGGICTEKYYNDAINYIAQRVSDPVFVVFSNDMEWARDWVKKKDIQQITVNNKRFDDYQDWYDMCLMTHCHHNILANSTFSWWGGWLNSHHEKIVICPPRWDNINQERKMVCGTWIEIGGT